MRPQIKKSAVRLQLIVILIIDVFHKSDQSMYVYNGNRNDSSNISELIQSITPEVHSLEECALMCHAAKCPAFTYDVGNSLCNFIRSAFLPYTQVKQLYVELFPLCLCNDLSDGSLSDVYTIPLGRYGDSVEVFCDMDTDGGGWTVIQNRFDGHQDFYNTWEEYKTGFGDLKGEFWIGNDIIHLLTNEQRYELYIELADVHGDSRYAKYDTFAVSSEEDDYQITLSGFQGTVAMDTFIKANSSKFSTKDKDNDEHSASCAIRSQGGWWYKKCHAVNLNGLYSPSSSKDPTTMCWSRYSSTDHSYISLAKSKMMVRPVNE